MTHRGPFQPLLFCDSVILWVLVLTWGETAGVTLKRSAFLFTWLWSPDKWLVGRPCCCSKGGGDLLCGVACSFAFHSGSWDWEWSFCGLSSIFCCCYFLAGDLQYDDKKFCSPFQDLANPKSQNYSVWLTLISFPSPYCSFLTLQAIWRLELDHVSNPKRVQIKS